MVTRDALKVLKLHSPTARAILRSFKTSLVPINHEMTRVHTISYTYSLLICMCVYKSELGYEASEIPDRFIFLNGLLNLLSWVIMANYFRSLCTGIAI